MSKNTREKLVNTAQDLIGASSYASVGVAEICKQAGVNKGSFYHFFKSKEELALEALDKTKQEIAAKLDNVFYSNKPAIVKLDEFIECFYNHLVEDFEKHGKVLGCPAVNLGSEMATQNQHFCDSVNNIFKHFNVYFTSLAQDFKTEGLVDEDADPQILGKLIHTYILGVKVIAKIENSPLILRQQLKSVLLNILGVK